MCFVCVLCALCVWLCVLCVCFVCALCLLCVCFVCALCVCVCVLCVCVCVLCVLRSTCTISIPQVEGYRRVRCESMARGSKVWSKGHDFDLWPLMANLWPIYGNYGMRPKRYGMDRRRCSIAGGTAISRRGMASTSQPRLRLPYLRGGL